MRNIRTLFTLLLTFVFSGILIAQTEEEVSTFFSDSDTLELYGESFSGLQMLDSVVGKHSIFITGENHTYTESNARLWLKMIKYLHKNAGVRNIMFEYGYSYGWLVNEYLQTGDSVLFNSIKNFAYIEYSNAIKDLRKFNESLDSSEKIYLCAIDIERGIYPIAKLLNHLIPEEYEAHDSIILHLESIASLSSYNDQKLEEQEESALNYVSFNFLSNPTLNLVQENFMKFEDEYKAVLGDNFDLFKTVIIEKYNARKLWYKYDNEKAVQQYVYRENYMHQRFLIERAEHPGNWFGQFGRCHTTQTKVNSNSCDWYMFKSLANRIKNTKGGELEKEVLTISIMYENDRSMGVEKEEYEDLYDKYFESVPESSIVLFDIKQDTLIDSVYGPDFNYVFLNTNTKKGEVYESYFDYYDYAFNFETKFKFTGAYLIKSFNFGNLNTALSDASINTFDESVEAWEISFITGSGETGNTRLYTGSTFGWYPKMSVEAQDESISYDFSGFYLKNIVLFNLTPGLGFVDIFPGLGYGYERLKLVARENTTSSSNLGTGNLGEYKSTPYFNPAFVGDALMIVDLNLGPVTLGVQYGYTFDFSKTQWKTDGELLNESPSTSLSNSSMGVRLGFNF